MLSLRAVFFASLALLFTAQTTAAIHCCPTTEMNLDHPPRAQRFVSVAYDEELVNEASAAEEGANYDNLPKETVFNCKYEDNITCTFRLNGELKTVAHSLCHNRATNIPNALAAKLNKHCPKK